MQVEFMNLERFKDFIRENAKLEERDFNFYMSHVIILAMSKKGYYRLDTDDTKHSRDSVIYFEYDLQKDMENDEEYLAIKF